MFWLVAKLIAWMAGAQELFIMKFSRILFWVESVWFAEWNQYNRLS